MSEHPIFSPTLDGFVLLAYMLTVSAALWFAVLFRAKRYLFVKPSVILLLWTHVLFQWPSAIFSAYYESVLPDPYTFLLLIHGFVFVGLLVSQTTGQKTAEEVFDRLKGFQPTDSLRPALVLSIYCGLVVALYLSVVPLSMTGLYAIIAKPELAALARSESLKQLANPGLIYLYSTMSSGVAPVLAVMLAFLVHANFRSRNVLGVVIAGAGVIVLLLAASLPGARGTAVKLLLVIAFAFLLRKGLPFRPLRTAIIVATVLAPAVLLSLLREGQTISAGTFFVYLGNYIFSRAFIMPLQVGAFYLHYAQTYGLIGIAAVPRLALLLGVTPIDVPDTIGNLYAYSGIPTVRASANGGFLFSYYAYFGLLSLPVSLVLLWLLDWSILLYRRLSDGILLPTVAAVAIACLAFVSSDFSTVLVTHGFLAILLVAWLLNELETKRAAKRLDYLASTS